MKKYISKIWKNLALGLFALLLFFPTSCGLDEDTYSIYTPETFYSSETAVLSSLSGVYRNLGTTTTIGGPLSSTQFTADHIALYSKIQGHWDSPTTYNLMEHKWIPDDFGGTYDRLFQIVGQANGVLASLEGSELEGIEGPKAELRTLRAYAYFFLMDFFGDVPIFLEARVDPLNLPVQNTRAEVFEFVVSELKEAAEILPSTADVGPEYYGRVTKEAAYALLAYTYLNGEVYTGTSYNQEALDYADLIIDTGEYELLPNYFDNFTADNEDNAEMIFNGIYSPNDPGGPGQTFVQKVLPGITGGLFGLPYTPQNGYACRLSTVEEYEDQDIRKTMFFPYGPLIDPRNGETVMVERIVPDGNSIIYREGISTEGPVPYEIIAPESIRYQPMNAGIKWIKWQIDPATVGGNAGNDISFFRYADILLIKAEALAREGNFADALPLVNEIRERSNATPLVSLTLEDILEERGRELVFEWSRRTDLIRFDKFNDPWQFKEASEPFRKLFPIPNTALDANPNLVQNPGY